MAFSLVAEHTHQIQQEGRGVGKVEFARVFDEGLHGFERVAFSSWKQKRSRCCSSAKRSHAARESPS